MKYKTFVRGFSLFETGAFGYTTYACVNLLSKVDYEHVVNFIKEDNPLEHKILGAVLIAGLGLVSSASGVFTLDGVVSTVKGQPFYGILKGLEKMTKNPVKKDKISKEIKRYDKLKELEIKLNPSKNI